MKVNIFMPKYMMDFKCINSKCIDTCCAGWDINIDEDTYNKYANSSGQFEVLLKRKFFENKYEHDFFNHGFMLLKDGARCPFLNCDMLCDIHKEVGEENLCITCKSYPRVFNIVDNVYEKSGVPSCMEICVKAFLNKDKMEFVECEEELDEKSIEIRRIIDSEAFEGSESLLQYFWDIRVISINIMQMRNFTIEDRLNIIRNFYQKISKAYETYNFNEIEKILEEFNNESIKHECLKGTKFREDNEFYISIAQENLLKNIKSSRLKEIVKSYKNGILKYSNISTHIEGNGYFKELEKYSYILENYLVNQIFKDIIPFNKGTDLTQSIKILINSYRIIKAYIIGNSINSNKEITAEQIVNVIQALSKDTEHNKVFKEILSK